MNAKSLVFLCLFIAIYSTFDPFVKKSIYPNRFSQILLPIYEADYFPNEVFKYSVFISPTTRFVDLENSLNLCGEAQKQILQFNLSNSCEDYFQNTKTPYFVKQSNFNAHTLMHLYCTQCEETENQRFNSTGKLWFDSNYCKDKCNGNSTCLYFRNQTNLCYIWNENFFVRRTDFTHLVWFNIFYTVGPMITIIINLILLFLTFFLVLIPEDRTKCDFYVSLRLQTVFFLFIKFSVSIIAGILDLINFMPLRLYVVFLFSHTGILFICFFLIIFQWKYILDKSDFNEIRVTNM